MNELFRTLGLRSAIRHRHGDLNTPPTQHRGSVPIDDIYMSHDINTVRSGFLPFGDGPGDHRALYVDVTKKSLIGTSIHDIHRQQARRLVTSDKRTVDKFNNLFQQQLDRNHVIERMETLNTTCGSSISSEQQIEYEKLDKFYVEAFHYANKRCRKLKAGEVAFAPETLQFEVRRTHLWNLCLRKRSGCKVSSRLINRLAKEINISQPMKISVDQMKRHRNEAREKYKELKPNSRDIRDSWLERKAINKYGTNETELGV